MKYNKQHEENPFEDSELIISDEAVEKLSELSKTAFRLYNYINSFSYRNKGIIYFDKDDAKVELEFSQMKSIYNGLNELVAQEILAGRKDSTEFYFNPKYIKIK